MSPLKKLATKKSSKRQRTSLDAFWDDDVDMAFNDHYKKALIILERTMDLETLKGTFILDVFKERTWTKLVHPKGNVFEIIICEFFASAIMEGGHINCWLRGGGGEFSITRDSIQDVL